MNVLVTGGKGNVGRAMVKFLSQRGHRLTVLDYDDRVDLPEVRYVAGDVTQFDGLLSLAQGQAAILHLAAIPHPGFAPGVDVFRINTTAAFNIFEAAAQAGVRRVVCASSINALGYNFSVIPFNLSYFPVDEAHPLFTTDAYSFSKQITEDIAAYYWRREGISSVCLRLPGVYDFEQHLHGLDPRTLQPHCQQHQALVNLPPDEALRQAQQAVAVYDARRVERAFEQPSYLSNAVSGTDIPYLMPMGGFGDLWAIISTQDTAQACEQALLADYDGSHPLFITERDNVVGADSERLAQAFFPTVTRRSHALTGCESLLSWRRAQALLGFEPQFALRQLLERN